MARSLKKGPYIEHHLAKKVDAMKLLVSKLANTDMQDLERLIDEACGDESHPYHFLYRSKLYYSQCLEKSTIEGTLEKDLRVLRDQRDVAAFRLIHRDSSRAVTQAMARI